MQLIIQESEDTNLTEVTCISKNKDTWRLNTRAVHSSGICWRCPTLCHWHTVAVVADQPNTLLRQSKNTHEICFHSVRSATVKYYPQQVQQSGDQNQRNTTHNRAAVGDLQQEIHISLDSLLNFQHSNSILISYPGSGHPMTQNLIVKTQAKELSSSDTSKSCPGLPSAPSKELLSNTAKR